MRISRKAVAVVAAGLLASPVVASSVSAQSSTTQKVITTSAVFVGQIPTGITGVTATLDCKNLTDASNTFQGRATLSAAFGTAGGATATNSLGFGLNPVGTQMSPPQPGSSCRVIASTTGTASRTTGVITVSMGGVDRPVVTTTTPANTATGAIAFNTSVTDWVAAYSDTSVVITVTYPQITVKKVVNGDEPVAGFAYPMSVNCANPAFQPMFVSGTSGDFYSKSTYGAGRLVTGGAKFNGVATPGGTISTPANYSTAFHWADGSVSTLSALTTASMFTIAYNAAGDATVAAVAPATGGFTKTGAIGTLSANFLSVFSGTTQYLVFDGAPLPPAEYSPSTGALLDSPANTLRAAIIAAANAYNATGNSAPASISLKGSDPAKVLGINEFPGMTASSVCEVTELSNQGGVTAYSSTTAAGTTLGGVQAGSVFKSALTAANQTITVTNSFYGDLVISKVVTGDSKSNIATFEISVACDKGGPKDTFLLKDRQSKVYNNIAAGTNCLVTETKSDGAIASYSDNVGDNTTDGRVTIKRRANGCAAVGAATPASPGGPAPVTSFDECWANVIITNDYNPPATTEAPATAAPATAAPATAAPAVTPAPATPVEATATFTG